MRSGEPDQPFVLEYALAGSRACRACGQSISERPQHHAGAQGQHYFDLVRVELAGAFSESSETAWRSLPRETSKAASSGRRHRFLPEQSRRIRDTVERSREPLRAVSAEQQPGRAAAAERFDTGE